MRLAPGILARWKIVAGILQTVTKRENGPALIVSRRRAAFVSLLSLSPSGKEGDHRDFVPAWLQERSFQRGSHVITLNYSPVYSRATDRGPS
jgi:hypothetical protein